MPNFGMKFGVPELFVRTDYKDSEAVPKVYPIIAYYHKDDFGEKIKYENVLKEYGAVLDKAGFVSQGEYKLQDGGKMRNYLGKDYAITIAITSVNGEDVFVVEVRER